MSKKYLLGIIYLSLFPISFASLAFQEQQYNPVVFNLAQLYDFNPVRGAVKQIKSVVYNEDKSINYESMLKIGHDGCVESFSFDQKKDEYLNGAHNYLFVKRVKNKLIGRDVSGPVEMVIGDNCQIMSKKDSNGELIYQYNQDGIIAGSLLADTKKQYSKNDYNEFKLPTTIKYFKDNAIISETIVTYGKDMSKPFDHMMDIRALGQTILLVNSKCDYNAKNIAYKCDFILSLNSNGNEIKLLKNSTTEVDFY
ncbi:MULTISPECIES: YnfC family lipoprotein [unclassified Providencia]|uniref:YnfC family lipoprotein n=1 Tax=unclassified Providencia TaxID=2633465 RepID=UPI001A220735|nr:MULTISPECIES: YnfC family lipoprotein [unclassified Providencia]